MENAPTSTPKQKRTWQEWLVSDAVLGSLVVLFTVATAFAAFRASVSEIEGGDLDVNSQKSLILGTTTYLDSNMEYLEDIATYDTYNLLKDDDPEAAAELFSRASPEMLAGLEREGGPFDEVYEEARYETAVSFMKEAQDLNEQGNLADDKANKYQKAAFILAIGLAITAWASLFDTRPKLRLIFTLLALPCLGIGLWLLLITAVT